MAEMAEDANSEDLLREQQEKISTLERQKLKHEEQLALLRSELGAMQIKQKEESYWLRLEVDNLRNEKEATEDRLAELYRDLRELDVDEDPMQAPVCVDSHYVLHLQSQLSKSMQTMGILDNQITMVKSSCDEVVKSLKEEIADVMDDKCRMEMELMNQLAVLDHEKREMEVEFDEQLRNREEKIAQLQQDLSAQSHASSSRGPPTFAFKKADDSDLVNKLNAAKEDKKKLEQELAADKAHMSETVAKLQDKNQQYEQKIESLASDLEVMRQGAAAEAVQVLDALARDRQETLTTLERVALIWEKADDSIQQLEDVMDELRPLDEDQVQGDQERALSTLETASLVHAQIKVSLLLVELKLRNQLTSLKNDKLRMNSSVAMNEDSMQSTLQKANDIQQEALSALTQVDQSLTQQIEDLRDENNEEADALEKELEEKTAELQKLQDQNRKMTEELSRLRSQSRSDRSKPPENGSNGDSGVSEVMINRLRKEVLSVVDKIKEKNEAISRLNQSMEEHKVREAALKKELKRMMKRARTMDEEKEQNPAASAGRANRRSTYGGHG